MSKPEAVGWKVKRLARDVPQGSDACTTSDVIVASDRRPKVQVGTWTEDFRSQVKVQLT